MLCSTETAYGALLRSLVAADVPSSHRLHEHMLRGYQRYLADLIEQTPCLMLAVPMGLGKTGATLTAVRRLLRAGVVRRVIVVAPLMVAKDTWPDEIRDWSHLADLDYAVCVGTETERLAALARDAEITIINRENIRWLWRKVGGRAFWRWDMLVYDESSRLKGFSPRSAARPSSDGKKKKAMPSEFGVLANVRDKITRVVELTGTPSPNGLKDLGGQAYILDKGERLGTSKSAFLDRWFDQSKYDYGITPKPFAEEQIMSRMKDIMFGLRAEDHIQLPPKMFFDRYVRLSDKHMKEYRAFEKTSISDAYDVEACSRGVLTNKLLQFANGSLYRMPEGVENARREVVPIHDEKLTALDSIIEEANGANILIAYGFQFDLERIRKRYPKIHIFDETKNFKERWNNGELNIAIAHPASMAHGLNLQFGGHIQVWYGLTWSLEFYLQFNQRLARPGQPNDHVLIYRIIAKGTADEDVIRAMDDKSATQDSVTEAVRVRVLSEYADAA